MVLLKLLKRPTVEDSLTGFKQDGGMPTGLGESRGWSGVLTPVVRGLLIANVAVFVVQALMDRAAAGFVEELFGLGAAGFMRHYYWQFLTYQFLHGSVLHILLNLLMLFMMGPELERAVGARDFALLYLLSGVLGGVGWLILAYPHEGVCVGASGSIFGLLGAFAALFPKQRITVLLFFILPVTLEAWLLVAGLSLIQLMYLLNPSAGGIAYAAHLAGAVAGYVFAAIRYRATTWKMPNVHRLRADEPDQAVVDRILDKISSEGIHALTARERKILAKASRRGAPRS